jgi:hypothetical protein
MMTTKETTMTMNPKEEILEVMKLPGSKAKIVVKKQPPVYTSRIDARLNEVLKGSKPLNRSSDLVPLSRDFDQMRKQLRSLIAAAKQHHAARVQVEKTRMEVRTL